MKTACFISFLFLVFISCTPPKFYQSRINDIPTSYPNFNTEIRFIEDSLPARPYFEIFDFDLIEKGKLSRRDIKQKLEIEAIKEGVDAIIQVEAWNESFNEGNFLTVVMDMMDEDNETTTVLVNYTHITGRGIMYLENLDFIQEQPEFEYFYKIDLKSDFPTPFFKLEYKLTGQVYMVYPETDDALEIYKKYFQYYSDFHLLKQREGWSYRMKEGKVKNRILWDKNGMMVKKSIPKYDDENRLMQVKIIHINDKIDSSEIIRYVYNDRNRITSRLVEIYDGTKVYEEYLYENNKLTSKNVIVNSPGQKQIKLHTSVRYYDPDYLKNYYFNEIANQQ